jgi:hypothetical protein
MSPMNMVTQLYPQALGSLFVASYESQGYGGGIQPRLHTGAELTTNRVLVITSRLGPTENAAHLLLKSCLWERVLFMKALPSNNYGIFAYLAVVA